MNIVGPFLWMKAVIDSLTLLFVADVLHKRLKSQKTPVAANSTPIYHSGQLSPNRRNTGWRPRLRRL